MVASTFLKKPKQYAPGTFECCGQRDILERNSTKITIFGEVYKMDNEM